MDILNAISEPLGRSDLVTDVRYYATHVAEAIEHGYPALLTLDAVGPNGLLTRSLREEARKYARYQISNLRIDFQCSSNPFKVFGAYGVGFHEDPQYAIDPFKSRQRALTLQPNGQSMSVNIPILGGWRYLLPDQQTRRTSSYGSVFFPSFCGLKNGELIKHAGADTFPPIATGSKTTGRQGITVLVTYDIRFADPIHVTPLVTTVRSTKIAMPTGEEATGVTVNSHLGSRRTVAEMVVQLAHQNSLTHIGTVAPNIIFRPSTNVKDPKFHEAAFPRDSRASAFQINLVLMDATGKVKAKLTSALKYAELIHYKQGPTLRVATHDTSVDANDSALVPTESYKTTLYFDGAIPEKQGEDYYLLQWTDLMGDDLVHKMATLQLSTGGYAAEATNPTLVRTEDHVAVLGDVKIQSPLPDGWGMSTHLQDIEMSLLDDNFYTLNIQ